MQLYALQRDIMLLTALFWVSLAAKVKSKYEAGHISKADSREKSSLLNILLGKEMEEHIKSVARAYEIGNAKCQASYGQHWFYNQGIGDCQFCGERCPYGTQGDPDCNLDCGRYWREIELNQTLLEIEGQVQSLVSTTNVTLGLSIAAVVIVFTGLAILSLATRWTLDFAQTWKTKADETYEKKHKSPQSDCTQRSDPRKSKSNLIGSATQATQV